MDPNVGSTPQVPTPPPPVDPITGHPLRFTKYFWIFLAIFIAITAIGSTAYFLNRNQTKQISTVQSSPTPIPGQTENWKTYTNPDLNFSFRYPPDIFIEQQNVPIDYITGYNGKGILISSASYMEDRRNIASNQSTGKHFTHMFAIAITEEENVKQLTPQEIVTQYITTVKQRSPSQMTEEIVKKIQASEKPYKVNSLDALYAELGEEKSINIFITKDNKLYIISPIIYTRPYTTTQDKAESQQIIDHIISTFKFKACTPRPACLDATPKCMIPETPDMCPPSK